LDPGVDSELVTRLRARAADVGFDAVSDPSLGDLLAALTASKPGGRFLELGTGVGVGTACLLRGMDGAGRLTTIEKEAELSLIAQEAIQDDRVDWVVGDGAAWLSKATDSFDLVFADTWPGKFTHLEEALALIRPGGLYVVDDLVPQPHWPDDHRDAVKRLVATLRSKSGWITAQIQDASGLLLCTRT
jgi:predicted O-methyltransferase YrrM